MRHYYEYVVDKTGEEQLNQQTARDSVFPTALTQTLDLLDDENDPVR